MLLVLAMKKRFPLIRPTFPPLAFFVWIFLLAPRLPVMCIALIVEEKQKHTVMSLTIKNLESSSSSSSSSTAMLLTRKETTAIQTCVAAEFFVEETNPAAGDESSSLLTEASFSMIVQPATTATTKTRHITKHQSTTTTTSPKNNTGHHLRLGRRFRRETLVTTTTTKPRPDYSWLLDIFIGVLFDGCGHNCWLRDVSNDDDMLFRRGRGRELRTLSASSSSFLLLLAEDICACLQLSGLPKFSTVETTHCEVAVTDQEN
jgi:hypothetical protein